MSPPRPDRGKQKTMTMTKIPSQKICYTYGHGPLKIYFVRREKNDDHDQDSLKKQLATRLANRGCLRQKSSQLIRPKMLWRGRTGLCGHRSKRHVALAQHGVAQAQTSFAQLQVNLGNMFGTPTSTSKAKHEQKYG